MNDKKKVSRELWERTARRELQNLLDFLGIVNTGFPIREVELCQRIRELLDTETEPE